MGCHLISIGSVQVTGFTSSSIGACLTIPDRCQFTLAFAVTEHSTAARDAGPPGTWAGAFAADC